MEIVLEALLDTIKLVPFLYVVYIIIGYFEVHSDNRLYKKLGNIEESNKHLQEAIKYAKAFDELKDYEEHISILVEGNEYKKEKTSRGDNKSHLDFINELLSK